MGKKRSAQIRTLGSLNEFPEALLSRFCQNLSQTNDECSFISALHIHGGDACPDVFKQEKEMIEKDATEVHTVRFFKKNNTLFQNIRQPHFTV